MTVQPTKIYVPASVGRAALTELDRVPWATLAHAYGTGKVRAGLDYDVEATLCRFGDSDEDAVAEATDALFSNLCHQGTIYEATAHAVPFLAAFAAGVALSPEDAGLFVDALASIGIAASFEAPHGSHAGSHGKDVGPLTREAIAASSEHLRAMALLNPSLKNLEGALAALARNDASAVERLRAILSGRELD